VWKISSALVRLAAPILVFTSEEIWKFLPKSQSEPESVHMALFPASDSLTTGLEENKKQSWEKLLGIRSEVLSALETARDNKTIASSLGARITLVPKTSLAPEERQRLFDFLRTYLPQFPALFIVSQAEVSTGVIESPGSVADSGTQSELIVVVHRADGAKCERCWNYSKHVGENPRYPTVCERCTEALGEIESTHKAEHA